MDLWDEFEPYTYRDALLEKDGDASALRAAIAADPDQLRGLLDEVVDEGTTEQATRALAIVDAIGRLDADDLPTAPVGWLDRGDETLGVWATDHASTYMVTTDCPWPYSTDVLDTIRADSDEDAVGIAAESFDGCGFLVINGEQLAYLTGAEFDERIITNDEMAEVWRSLNLDGASALRVQLMRNSMVYFIGQLRDSALDEATRERYRVTMSAITCAIDCLMHEVGNDERMTAVRRETTYRTRDEFVRDLIKGGFDLDGIDAADLCDRVLTARHERGEFIGYACEPVNIASLIDALHGIDSHNFFDRTRADFSTVPGHPARPADYVSGSGSRYWYNDEGVVRESDRWGYGIASCTWRLDGSGYVETDSPVCGYCAWSDFERK
jgi:hypothetical protein